MAHRFSIPAARGTLPVLLPFEMRGRPADPFVTVRWLGALPLRWLLLMLAAWPALAFAQSGTGAESAWAVLVRWVPFLFKQGFLFNVLISLMSMLLGTLVGAFVGLGLIARSGAVRRITQVYVSFFRNAPWLVLLFIILLAFPFEVTIFGQTIPLPGWTKTVIGLALPVSANVAEVVRGAVQSVPSAQWEAAESLAFTRRQTVWQIILPQCVKRMIPPWMNWYAIVTMSTPLCSLLGVGEIISLTRQAMEAEGNRPELLIPFYGFALMLFLLYCYPIARLTQRLERRFAVKL